ncbi:uncharacterized protein [Nicotiana sylvestris]|uniref:uncharacterized protein n=1 Tax=Nicotiana sylvestris TaxID=4096 RepID=UPI00388C5BA7
MRRYCPRLWGKAVQQSQQPMISALATPPPPRGGGQTGRGRPRGGGQAGRGQPAITQSGGGQTVSAPARFYALLSRLDALASDAVITGLPRLEWKGSTVNTSSRVISFLKARHMVEKGCLAYLAYVRDTTAEFPTIVLVPVVQEFADVFLFDLPGMPPDRDIDFCIDLAPGTQPVSIPLYHMALMELKEQLEELLAKGV